MTIVFNGNMNIPNYTALSTDIVGGALPGAQPGRIVFISDTVATYIVRADLQLVPYALPVEVTVSSDIDIGAVHIDQQLTESVALTPYFVIKSVPTPGTAVALASTATYVISATIFPKVGNTDSVYLGTSDVDKSTSQQIIITTTSAGFVLDAPLGYKLNLADWYIDAVDADNGVRFIYLK